jgi:predicted CoA-substrate-specific enzyme activase
MNDKNEIYLSGLEIGSVSVKWVYGTKGGKLEAKIFRHEGNPGKYIREILDSVAQYKRKSIVVTGRPVNISGGVQYHTEFECLERGLAYHGIKPDILLALGGENFTVYPMKDGLIKNMIAASKCAAGTGEFLVQQFQRMGYTLEEGIAAYGEGKPVELATRCSVYCKSDATHKLNKGECVRADIARSLNDSLAERVCKMIELAKWPSGSIVVSGGLAQNKAFMQKLSELMSKSELIEISESAYLGAFGAYLFASEASAVSESEKNIYHEDNTFNETLSPLYEFERLLDFRAADIEERSVNPGGSYVLAVDAGSTTTKAILLNTSDLSIGASCYLRTMGNPVQAARNCLNDLIKEIGERDINIIQAAATGSAREMVSVYLDNCLSFNEILAHARAAREETKDVETLFEIGGQDSKFTSFLNGVPVDYAMNEGCSAGTGSFLEESVSLDMGIDCYHISNEALKSANPIRFGERCAAFINTDLRSALQEGAKLEDVIAGLVYSIAENYITRIVGSRALGETIMFQGGVALNKSVALAMAARTGKKIIVPKHPELMGCVGAALMALDLLRDKHCSEKKYSLQDLSNGSIEVKGNFRCLACDNRCEIQKMEVAGKTYPFGGLCSRFENMRHGNAPQVTGRDYIELRNKMMFKEFGPVKLPSPKGAIGLPMALTAYELLPFYAKLVNEMGYNLVLSAESKTGNTKTMAQMCYPCEIVHGGVYDLINKKVDFILMPRLLEFDIPASYRHAFTCPSTATMPDVVRTAFGAESDMFLSPHIALAGYLKHTTQREIVSMAKRLGVSREIAERAFNSALAHYMEFRQKKNELGKEASELTDEPCIILTGRPYIVCANDVNFALPRKITSRGYNVISSDMLPFLKGNRFPSNLWYFTALAVNAVEYVNKFPHMNLCLFSCFSCVPDASINHLIRDQLAGNVFCYLEIDSHTAHAGIETRIGAFLDILEEKKRRTGAGHKGAVSRDTAQKDFQKEAGHA